MKLLPKRIKKYRILMKLQSKKSIVDTRVERKLKGLNFLIKERQAGVFHLSI